MIFEHALAFYFKAKTFAENRKRKQKRERELELTCRPGRAQLGPAHWLLPVIPLLSPGGREARARCPQPHAGHHLLLPTPRTPSTRATHSPSSPSHFPPLSPCPSPSSGSLPIPSREELVATVAVHCGHRPPLVSSTCPRAPPTSSSSSRASHDASDALQRR